ncbi:MAG TPA: TAT-variant-translocated molybdopterin oxidoreductase [Pirellulaceae bacterium]
MNSRKQLDAELDRWQERLAGKRASSAGREYWQSLEELAESSAFVELVKQEFPDQADVWPDALSRRRFLTLMAASLALGGLSGCSVRPAPAEKIVPYVHPQEGVTPGRPLFFATTMSLGGDAVGLLVESQMGRPTKVEGNPDHPASLGATDAFHQASILTLYDPDRSQTITYNGQIRAWSDAERALRQAMAAQRPSGGAGLRLLTERINSPTLGWQIQKLLREFPEARWHQYQPINDDNALHGAELAFGETSIAVYDFSRADVVVALDSDWLAAGPGHLRYAREFMKRRSVGRGEVSTTADMNRLYVVEPAVTCTGAKADHRLAVRGSEIALLARTLAAELGPMQSEQTPSEHGRFINALARDLEKHRGRSIVVAGPRQPPEVHAIVHAINERLDNIGNTVRYIEPPLAKPVDGNESLKSLVDEIRANKVETFLILGGNPVYTAPADFELAEILPRVPLRFRLGLYADETSQLCQWHLPEAHYLESWSDARAFDGTASIVQPLIEPLYQGRSAHEVLAVLNEERKPGDEIVRGYWRENRPEKSGGDFEDWWQTALHDGVIADSSFDSRKVRLREDWQQKVESSSTKAASRSRATLEIAFAADPTIYDGAFANNGWLQELPKPLTKLTWDNAAIVSPETATQLRLKIGAFAHGGEHGGYEVPVVELRLNGRSVRAPVWILPGHVDGAVTVHLGYGRRAAGRVGGSGNHVVGFNAFSLRQSTQPWFGDGLTVELTKSRYPLACTQAHHALDGRDIIRGGTVEEFEADRSRWKQPPRTASEKERPAALPETIYPPFNSGHTDKGESRHRWGMVIDLTACTGCSACVVACQAENNIPVVGKEQVLAGREMHWLRIDRYMAGSAEQPEEFHFQPLPCMHCEHAPCEYVCPVAATVHSADGLNDMVYNRCVGTRFCSNNCPYKVRRFNFLAYSDFDTPTRRLQYNTEVTVRSRGVMEKCTYCVQRIRSADIDAEAAGRELVDGDCLTACQAVCPTQAIVFGDMNDANSRVHALKESPLEYGLLTELNTFPRTTYLAELRNPNPELERVE